ncbi:MAG TPA: urease accessory protein UreD [Devosia sp.]|nr:urease accessory protein UreD [Devosia sp.]
MAAVALAAARPTAPLQRARGHARLGVAVRDGRSEVSALFQEGCAKIRLPNTHDASLQAVLMNTAGGLCGDDHLEWYIEAQAQARVAVTTPACERVYRSIGGAARIENRLVIREGAHLDWLPQETILFEGSELERSLEVDLAADASFTAVEAVLLGRAAMGERARNAGLTDNWRIRRNGRLIHAESTRLTGDPLERDGPSLLDGALALATILHIAPEVEMRLDAVRSLLPMTAGASVSGERLTVRVLAESGLALRRAISPIIALLSKAGTPPRLWHL